MIFSDLRDESPNCCSKYLCLLGSGEPIARPLPRAFRRDRDLGMNRPARARRAAGLNFRGAAPQVWDVSCTERHWVVGDHRSSEPAAGVTRLRLITRSGRLSGPAPPSLRFCSAQIWQGRYLAANQSRAWRSDAMDPAEVIALATEMRSRSEGLTQVNDGYAFLAALMIGMIFACRR